MASLYGSEGVKCFSVEWDFLQGLLVKNQPVPCLQALRKEKSRNAARSRRGKENFEFYELAKLLPLPGAITSQLDKASIVRLSITYLKMRHFALHGDPPWTLRAEGPGPAGNASGRRNMNGLLTEIFEKHLGGHILQVVKGDHVIPGHCDRHKYESIAKRLNLDRVTPGMLRRSRFMTQLGNNIVHRFPDVCKAPSSQRIQMGLVIGWDDKSLDGFVFALNQEGKFLYISETVSIYLGLSQVELTGSSIFDYVHPGDHHEVAEQLGLKAPLGPGQAPHPKAPLLGSSASSEGPQSAEGDGALERSFFIRLKSTLTKRGLHIKTSGYKVIHVTGRLRSRRPSHPHGHSVLGRVLGLVALAHTLPPSTLSEVRIECHMFVFRVNMDLQIVYCESRITDYMDLCPSELVGKSCYRFIHGEDVEGIQQSHLDLLNKGQVVTRYYRWLQKSGGFVWVQSCATISINVKNPSERNMVWVNYILSKPECKNIALDVFQVPGIPARQTEAPSAGTDYKETDRGKPCPAGKPAGTLAQSYPRSVGEMGRHCHLVESKSRGPETKYPEEEEEALEEEAGSDTETPPRKRIKLEFPPESPPPKGKGETLLASSEDSDSSSDSEPEMVPQETGPLARKVNGCKPGGRKTLVPRRPCMSEFTSVIQTQKGASLRASPALSIKSEQGPWAKGGLWTCPGGKGSPFPANKAVRLEKPLVRQAPSHLYVSIPDSVLTPPEMDSGPAKGPFSASPRAAPSSSGDTLSPPLSGSPCEDRGTATPFTPLIYPTEMEVLQRFHTSNMVVPLMHQLGNPHASSSAGSPGLYTTSTIRYAPADMTLAMPSNMLPPSHHPLSLMDIGSAEAKTSREIMYHHLQRLNMVAPFGNSASLAQISGGAFAAADSLFSTLPFSVASGGIHSGPALERKED